MEIIESNLNFGSISYRNYTNRIILHHAEASTCTVEDVHRWHQARGWAGIGYHFFVRKDGSIYRGRPQGSIGAHASGANSDSIGICAEGCYMVEEMPESQRAAISELIAFLDGVYGGLTVLQHKQVGSTDCAGINYPFDEIVANVPVNDIYISEAGESNDCLGFGDRGDAVAELQQRLNDLGYDCGKVDGIFGSRTDSAVRQFQIDQKLKGDGLVGPKTQTALDNATVMESTPDTTTEFPLPADHWFGTPCSEDRNHSGYYDTGDRPAIKLIQQKLGVTVDGYFGPNTEDAVKKWQEENSDCGKVDGCVGIKTWNSMFN